MLASVEHDFLQQTNELIDRRLKLIGDGMGVVGENLLTLACRHLCISDSAKRARPLLCLYYHLMFSDHLVTNFVHIGVAAEFIHAASLLHDDIIDEADMRRGKDSANKMFGNATAVLAGDYLLTEAFELLRPFDRVLIDQAVIVLREMTKAASLEYSTRGNANVSLDVLYRIARGKTGILFAWCGFAAGHLCNKPEAAKNLWEIGQRIGLLFQMADDIKDFHGDKNLKDVCRDLRNLEPSIPIALAMQKNALIKQKFNDAFLQKTMDASLVSELKDMVIASGVIAETESLMAIELDKIMNQLAAYHGTTGRTYLDQWVSALLS